MTLEPVLVETELASHAVPELRHARTVALVVAERRVEGGHQHVRHMGEEVALRVAQVCVAERHTGETAERGQCTLVCRVEGLLPRVGHGEERALGRRLSGERHRCDFGVPWAATIRR